MRSYHADAIGRPQDCDQAFDGTVGHLTVRIEDKNIACSRLL